MDALFGGLGGMSDAPRGNHGCNSTEDLRGNLRNLIASKSSETRAEHISATFEFRYNTIFYLPVDADGAAAEDLDPVHLLEQQVTRTVNASETVLNQPSDDPALQKAVCKHVINTIALEDGSTWNVRSISRGAQGWTFIYHCQNSLTTWYRQNAKAERPPIAAYSGGLDPVNLSRPAFDCRGTINIAFSKSNRAIVVKYEHTPLHRTVSQLVELLAPVLLPPPTVNVGDLSKSTKAKRPPPAEGEEGGRKKRKRKSKVGGDGDEGQNSETAANSQEVAQTHPDAVHATSILNVPAAEAARRREVAMKLLSDKGIDPATLSPEQFNIFANQAPDLQKASLEMLAKYGAERLRIVHPDEKEGASNSSTPAQNSANMKSASAEIATQNPGTADTPSKKKPRKKKSNVIGGEATPDQPKEKKTRGACNNCKLSKIKCGKQKPSCAECNEAGEDCVYAVANPKPRKSDKPEPVENLHVEDPDVPGEADQPTQDNYSQPTQGNYAQHAQNDYSQPAIPEREPSPPPPQRHHQQPAQAAPMDPDNDEFIPDPNILSVPLDPTPVVPPAPSYNTYQPQSPGLTYAQQSTELEPQPRNSNPMSSMTFPQTSQSASGLAFPSSTPSTQPTQQSTGMYVSQQVPAPQQSQPQHMRHASRSAGGSRRSLPSASQGTEASDSVSNDPSRSDWNRMPSSPAIARQANSNSPTMAQQPPAKRPRSRDYVTGSSPQMYSSGLAQHQAAALSQLSQAAVQQSAQSELNRSPYQSSAQNPTARAKSRQGRRSQTSTPITQTPIPPPQLPTAHPAPATSPYNTATTTATASSVPTYDPYSRYNNSPANDHYSNGNNDQSTSRITYEPSSYNSQSTTASNAYTTPSYDYSRATTTANSLSSALSTSSGYGNSASNSGDQWSASHGRRTPSNATNSNPYSTQTASSQPYGRSTSRGQQSAAYGGQQSQQQSYSSYPSQQPSATQQQDQNWYGFASTNSNPNNVGYSSNSRGSGYGSTATAGETNSYQGHRSNVSGYSGHGYGSTDEQSIYDLLRAGHAGNH